MFSLTGHTALVTGGATGIGAAIASALAEAGADVAVTVNSTPADETCAAIKAAGRQAAEVRTDLAALDAKGFTALVDEVETRLGHVSILINNAGTIRRADAVDMTVADWSAVIEIKAVARFV